MAPQHATLDLEFTGAEAMWWVNADAVDWDIPTATETDAATAANSVPVAADATLSALPAIFTTATPVGSASVLHGGRWYASAQLRLAGGLAAARGRMACFAPRTI